MILTLFSLHTHTHCRWYHGAITRAEAEAVLASKRDFSFLVRNSESCRTDYSLSIRSGHPLLPLLLLHHCHVSVNTRVSFLMWNPSH